MKIIDTSKLSNTKDFIEKSKIKSSIYLEKLPKNIFNQKNRLQFFFFVILLSTITLFLTLHLRINNIQTKENINNISTFSPNTQINTLSQFLMESWQNHHSISNKLNESYSVYTKAKFDILTLNESLDTSKKNDLFFNKYKSVIIINSICFGFDEKQTNCKMKQYLDLTIKNSNTNEDIDLKPNDLEMIKDAVLPICIIEHSYTNYIISVSCPETLSDNLKDDIIIAFQSIKPNLSKENISNNELFYANITRNVNEKINEIKVNTFDSECQNSKKNKICETIQNITLDKTLNLKTNEKSIRIETIKDNSNKYYSIYNYSFKDISNKKDNNANKVNFKYNLKILLDLIKPLLIKTNHIDNLPSSNNVYRNLDINNQDSQNYEKGINEQNFFSETIFGLNIALNIKNDIGLGNKESSKVISNYIRGSKKDILFHDEIDANINNTLKEFINLSNAGNKLANLYYQNINKILKELPKEIYTNINDLNKILVFEDFSSSFDSIFAIDYVKILPFSIIGASQNLYSNLTYFNNTINNSISNIKNKLKENISSYIKNSHDLLDNIFEYLTQLYNALSSDENIMIDISSHYLNITQKYSFLYDIGNTKPIFDYYNDFEKNLIEKKLNDMFLVFSTNFVDSLRLINVLIDKIIKKLNDRSISISSGNDIDIENTINYLYKAKLKVYNFMPIIENELRNNIGIQQESGYFETQLELDTNAKKFGEIYNKSIHMESILYENSLIDTAFDENMKNFKYMFMNLLNYIDRSKVEKFALNDYKFFNSNNKNYVKMEQDFKSGILNILNFVITENEQYSQSNKQTTESFISKNKENLDKIINNIDVQLSELNLHILDTKYYEMLNTIFNSINNVIETNKNLAVQYFQAVYSSGSSHCTQLYLDKTSIYFNSFTTIRSFIVENLNSNIINRYKNIINNIRPILTKLKSNPIFKTYQTEISFTTNHLSLIDIILARFDKYISDNLFNTKYLAQINNFYSSTLNNLDQVVTQLNNLYNPVKKLSYSNSNANDYYKSREECERHCKRTWYGKKNVLLIAGLYMMDTQPLELIII